MNENEHTASPARTPIMDADAIRRGLRRIAHEIIEQNADLRSVVLAGIPLRGVSENSFAKFPRSRSKPAQSMSRCIATMLAHARSCR